MIRQYMEGTEGPFRSLFDYILGITHEIWESRHIERILDYYGADMTIYTLGGLVHGAAAVVQNTRDTLHAFPDRLLVGEAVIWSREQAGVFYSSHRIYSPMTNTGASSFGAATQRRVTVRTIADCLIQSGVVIREWLVRDNYSLVQQLGFDAQEIAMRAAARAQPQEFTDWIQSECVRVRACPQADALTVGWSEAAARDFAASVLTNHWVHGDADLYAGQFAPYVVLHDSAPTASGRDAVAAAYNVWRQGIHDSRISVDHVCVNSSGENVQEVAVRWMLAGSHRGRLLGVPGTGGTVAILGVTHWQIVDGRISSEWTVFDRMALLTQLYRLATL